jgi:hypothetical protein
MAQKVGLRRPGAVFKSCCRQELLNKIDAVEHTPAAMNQGKIYKPVPTCFGPFEKRTKSKMRYDRTAGDRNRGEYMYIGRFMRIH